MTLYTLFMILCWRYLWYIRPLEDASETQYSRKPTLRVAAVLQQNQHSLAHTITAHTPTR